MRFKTLYGKEQYKDCKKYLINWGKNERSKFQTEVKLWLRPFLFGHIVYSELPVFGTRMTIDIYDATKRIAYEIQGEQHFSYNTFMHGNRSKYLGQIKRDFDKDKYCNLNNIKLVEILPENMPLTEKWFEDQYGILF